jgi:hypothetical protein
VHLPGQADALHAGPERRIEREYGGLDGMPPRPWLLLGPEQVRARYCQRRGRLSDDEILGDQNRLDGGGADIDAEEHYRPITIVIGRSSR